MALYKAYWMDSNISKVVHTKLGKDNDKLAKMMFPEQTHCKKAYPFKQKYDLVLL